MKWKEASGETNLKFEIRNLKYTIQKNPKKITVKTVKGEKKIMLIVIDQKDMVAEIPITLSVATESQIYCIICCLLSGNSNVKLITHQKHSTVGGVSDLLCKTVLHKNAKFSFLGNITIQKSGQHSHAYQRNENLLLGTGTAVVSEPKLEILANDVFCTHGATTSYLDEEQVFYLQSRGMQQEKIESLMARGFLISALDKLITAGMDLSDISKLQSELEKQLTLT